VFTEPAAGQSLVTTMKSGLTGNAFTPAIALAACHVNQHRRLDRKPNAHRMSVQRRNRILMACHS